VLRLLKQDAKTRKIPVLLLTARAEKASMQYGLEMRATDYLIKPFVFSEVLAKVRACLGE
jgi:DNA-binding response OmpR family regulator